MSDLTFSSEWPKIIADDLNYTEIALKIFIYLSDHFVEPVFDGCVVFPPRLRTLVSDRVDSDLVTEVVQLVDLKDDGHTSFTFRQN